jgi:hypothetical protein
LFQKEEAPAVDRGFDMVCCYIFGLHFLAWASHIPPAFEQSACVFADATSAAKLGAVTASAKPKATIIETNFVMADTPILEGLTSGAPNKL